MPIYEFECPACSERFDRLQKLSDPDPNACPNCGAALAGWPGAVIGAVVYAAIEAIGDVRRKPAQPKPLVGRIVASALLMALFGWGLGQFYAAPLFQDIL